MADRWPRRAIIAVAHDDNPSNGDLARMLGRIEANQDNLWREFERERDALDIYQRGLTETISAISEANRTLTTQMMEIMPLVFNYRTSRDQAIGMAKMSKVLWALLLGISAFAGAMISKSMDHLK